jgi:DNA-binding protein YbaB
MGPLAVMIGHSEMLQAQVQRLLREFERIQAAITAGGVAVKVEA